MALLLGVSLCLYSAHARAQDATEPKPENKGDEAELPKPDDIDLTTDDGVQMKATYYPGTKGPESIPVIIFHGLDKIGKKSDVKHSRKEFTEEQGLAALLQRKLGCAVIVPDLRGYGESTKLVAKKMEELDDRQRNAVEVKLEKRAKGLKKELLSDMVLQDLRAVKNDLWKKNNQKKLNIEKLTVIGVEEGAAVALRYADDDATGYEQGQAMVGPLKLGKFVKAVVLVSPVTIGPNVASLKIPAVMRKPEIVHDLRAAMIVLGNQSKEYMKDAETLNTLFVKGRPPAPDNKKTSKTVWFLKKIETPLQGAKLLDEPSLKVQDGIVDFMDVWLVKDREAKEWEWQLLKKPYE